jgi:hypothetical protein
VPAADNRNSARPQPGPAACGVVPGDRLGTRAPAPHLRNPLPAGARILRGVPAVVTMVAVLLGGAVQGIVGSYTPPPWRAQARCPCSTMIDRGWTVMC